jgi:branched-subunit amino acid aminotransferase/4-amino-4-deoxychorismate lyase
MQSLNAQTQLSCFLLHIGLVSNVFIVKVDAQTEAVTVCTAHSNILHGAMRAVCIKTCKQLGYTVNTTDAALLLADAHTWHEMFLTGTCPLYCVTCAIRVYVYIYSSIALFKNTRYFKHKANCSLTGTRVVFTLMRCCRYW